MAKVLIVEDDATLANLIAEVLSADNHVVDVLNDGEMGAAKLCSGGYELAVLDWDLPQKCGIDICRDYREAGGRSPVLMLTGRDKVADKEAGFDAGADDYLTKPFSLKEFRARIKALLRRTGEYKVVPQSGDTLTIPSAVKSCLNCGASFDVSVNVCPHDGTDLLLMNTDPLLGARLDERYTVESVVARGGMAIIYKGMHERLKRPVAIKVMQARPGLDLVWLKRLQLEAIAVGRLSHTNVVAVYDFGVTPTNLPYLVMDFVQGQTLADILNEQKRLPLPRSLPVFSQICDGLEHAHEAGLVHRDLKPSNIMLVNSAAQQDLVKVLDFGIAKVLQEGDAPVGKLTETGQVVGTCYYMSPEQCLGGGIDRRSDIYSLGCVMYETLIGVPPIRGANQLATFQMHINESPRPISQVRPDLSFPREIEALIMKALEKQPDTRFQTMRDMKQQLDEVAAHLDQPGS